MRVRMELEAKQLEAKLASIHKQLGDVAGPGGAVAVQKGFKAAASSASNFVGIFTGNKLSGVTSQLTSLSGAISSIPGAAGLAVGSIGAITAAAVGAGAALFVLAKKASDFGSEIFDVTEKTGLSAETVSSLKVAADQAGTTLETVSAGLSKFAKTIGDNSDEARKKLTLLGVTSTDLDTALGQALETISKYPPGVKQMTAAQAAFGKSGADLLPFIKSFDGDLPGLIEKCKKLGLTLSDADAKAADDFGDTLDTLSAQAAATGRVFIGPLMRDITQAMHQISDSLATNQDTVREWGNAVAAAFAGATAAIKEYAQEGSAFAQSDFGSLLMAGAQMTAGKLIPGYVSAAKAYGDAQYRLHPEGKPMEHNIPGSSPFDQKGALTGLGPTEEELKKREKEMEDFRKREFAAQKDHVKQMLDEHRKGFKTEQDDLDKHFRAGEISFEDYKKNTLQNLRDYGKEAQRLIRERYKLDVVDATPGEQRNLNDSRIAAETGVMNEILKEKESAEGVIADIIKKQADREKESAANSLALAEANAAKRLEIIQGLGLSERSALIATQAEELKLIGIRRDAEKDESKRAALQLEYETKELKNKRELTELEKKLHLERRKSWSEYVKMLEHVDELEGKEGARKSEEMRKHAEGQTVLGGHGMGAGIAHGMGVSLPSIWKEVDDGMGNTVSVMKTQAEMMKSIYADIADFAGGAIGSMVDGLTQMGLAWLITGEFSGQAALKMMASTALSIATQAGFKAIFEYAEGLAALGTTWGVPNPSSIAHFAAATTYGTIAAIAGGAGIGLGLAARAAGGGGAAAGKGPGGSYSGSGSGRQEELSPYSRQSDDAFISGHRSGLAGLLSDRAIAALERIGSMQPMRAGDVLVEGARQKKGFIGDTAAGDVRSNAGTGRKLASAMGIR